LIEIILVYLLLMIIATIFYAVEVRYRKVAHSQRIIRALKKLNGDLQSARKKGYVYPPEFCNVAVDLVHSTVSFTTYKVKYYFPYFAMLKSLISVKEGFFTEFIRASPTKTRMVDRLLDSSNKIMTSFERADPSLFYQSLRDLTLLSLEKKVIVVEDDVERVSFCAHLFHFSSRLRESDLTSLSDFCDDYKNKIYKKGSADKDVIFIIEFLGWLDEERKCLPQLLGEKEERFRLSLASHIEKIAHSIAEKNYKDLYKHLDNASYELVRPRRLERRISVEFS